MAPSYPLSSNRAQEAIVAGQTALEEGRYEEAADFFRSALRMGGLSAEEEALIRCHLSEALEKRGLYREALEAVAKYVNFPSFVRLPDQTQMRVLVQLGWSNSYINDLPRAIGLFNQAMVIARRLGDDSGIGACYFGLGRAYRNLNEIRIASDHYTSALEHYRRVGDWRRLAESYTYIGQIKSLEGDYRSALNSFNQALAIIGDHEEDNLRGRIYTYSAVTSDRVGSTAKSLDAWERAIEHFSRTNNLPFLGINYNNLADKLIYLGDWARAEELLKSAIEMLRGTTWIASLGGVLDTLAQLCLLRGQLDEAERLLEESRRVLSSIKGGEWAEVSTITTTGRAYLVKGQPDEAIKSLERAIYICERSGDHHYFAEAQLYLAEAWLRKGELERAREKVENVRVYLSRASQMKWWGMMMRTAAKIEAAEGHIAAAIQLLGQSSSVYEINNNVYAAAINRFVLAQLLEKQGRIPAAINEVKAALSVFESLGATIDERDARSYQARLEALEASASDASATSSTDIADAGGTGSSGRYAFQSPASGVDLASAIDGFVAQRLAQASVSRSLLLHELASIVREHAIGRAALVVEIDGDSFKIAASVGLDERAQAKELEFLRKLPVQQHPGHFVYRFSDNGGTAYLLRVISPKAQRFLSGKISLRPLLQIVEMSLEVESYRSRNRRTQVFDSTRLLTEVELPGFICASRAMTRVLEQIHKIRSSDVTVLITGESGTGKELIARAVHAGSSRRFNVFLPFNCSAAPREMIESQLFGFRKGAFTGAIANSEGIIRAAERGTLFLDEIGDLPVDLQPKLLRFLQEGEVHPIGDSQPLHVDVRVIAATNSELERAVAEGKFREDLFHRLNVIRIQVPPLRERREEIPALINHYLNLYQKEAAKTEIQLSEEAVDLMVVYDWPGNVRQLCNEIRRVVAYNESGTIATRENLSPEIVRATRNLEPEVVAPKKTAEAQMIATDGKTIAEAVNEIERQMIQDALQRSSGNIARAAKELGLTRRGLYLKMDRLSFKV